MFPCGFWTCSWCFSTPTWCTKTSRPTSTSPTNGRIAAKAASKGSPGGWTGSSFRAVGGGERRRINRHPPKRRKPRQASSWTPRWFWPTGRWWPRARRQAARRTRPMRQVPRQHRQDPDTRNCLFTPSRQTATQICARSATTAWRTATDVRSTRCIRRTSLRSLLRSTWPVVAMARLRCPIVTRTVRPLFERYEVAAFRRNVG
mmetsp:Transcript_21951/g.48234  ORF Transcript_21951/g.48234 Transcript_21951/m.48234 type:complete len:203 (-) Transcript_21951:48-656(-)